MRSAIRKGKPRVEMEAVDRRAFAGTIATCEFIARNVDNPATAELATTIASSLKTLEREFPAKKQKPAAATA